MTIAYWDFNKSFMDNAKTCVIAEQMAIAPLSRELGSVIAKFGNDNGLVGEVEMLPYIRENYGSKKPICLGDKIIREIHRVLVQIREELDRTVENVDEFLDDTIPGWEEAGGVWEVFQDELLSPFEDEVLKPIEDGLKDAWNDFTDWVSDPC